MAADTKLGSQAVPTPPTDPRLHAASRSGLESTGIDKGTTRTRVTRYDRAVWEDCGENSAVEQVGMQR